MPYRCLFLQEPFPDYHTDWVASPLTPLVVHASLVPRWCSLHWKYLPFQLVDSGLARAMFDLVTIGAGLGLNCVSSSLNSWYLWMWPYSESLSDVVDKMRSYWESVGLNGMIVPSKEWKIWKEGHTAGRGSLKMVAVTMAARVRYLY